jgi:hypothetical protein
MGDTCPLAGFDWRCRFIGRRRKADRWKIVIMQGTAEEYSPVDSEQSASEFNLAEFESVKYSLFKHNIM